MWRDRIALPPDLAMHRALVIQVVGRFEWCATPTCDMDDIASHAVAGLIKAAATYRPEKASWTTWARRCIEQQLYRTLPTECGCVRVPVHTVGYGADANRLRLAALWRDSSLDAPAWEADGPTRKDMLRDAAPPVWEQAGLRIDAEALRALLRRYLSAREERMLFPYFGIAPYRRKTVFEIARDLGVTHQYVSQLCQAALRRLRKIPSLRAATRAALCLESTAGD